MGSIVVTSFVSLDGVMEDPGGAEGFVHGGWTFPYWNDEIAAVKLEELRAADALLLGRVTYAGFAAAWPDQTDEAGFADRMNGLPKYVVSSTLTEPGWSNSTVIGSDLPGEVAAIKGRHDGDVLVAGSARLVQGLTEHGLVDEYRLLVYPVVLGTGKRLFGDATHLTELDLAEARPLERGVLLLSYRPAAG
jgi:dihydrofolate reductase